MLCKTWILLLLLTVLLFRGQLSSTVPAGTLKKEPRRNELERVAPVLVEVLSQHCWYSCLLLDQCEIKLHSLCLCPSTAKGYHITGLDCSATATSAIPEWSSLWRGSQNHRMCWAGKDPQGPSSPAHGPAWQHCPNIHWALSGLVTIPWGMISAHPPSEWRTFS